MSEEQRGSQAEGLGLGAQAEPPEGLPQRLHQDQLQVDHHVQDGLGTGRRGSHAAHTPLRPPPTRRRLLRPLGRSHLAVLPVQALEGLDVLHLDPLREQAAPQVHLPEAGQLAGRR